MYESFKAKKIPWRMAPRGAVGKGCLRKEQAKAGS